MTVALHYEADGTHDASPLVLSPSLGSTLAMWDPQEAELGAHFHLIRHDHRGHGGSPVPPGPYDLDDLGRDALALLDELGLRRVDWCGLSLGGMVGMWLAAHAPTRIGRLVLCCTSARLGPPSMWRDRARLVREEGMDAVADAGIGRWLTPAFVERCPETAAWLRGMIAATPPDGYVGCCGVIERMDLEPVLKRIHAPTLVIAAAQDPATPPEHGERIAAGIPDARLEVIDDAAHLANVERPEAVTDLITDFLL